MNWRFEWVNRKDKKYGQYKANYREEGKQKSKYVYLGNEEWTNKIRSDIISKEPNKDVLYDYTGEVFLLEISKRLKFSKIIDKYVSRDSKWSIGKFIETIVIERALNPFSKWAISQKIYCRSVLSQISEIPLNAFSEDNIYNYMDYFEPFIHQIQKDLVNEVYKLFPQSNETLLLDGTSFYAYNVDTDQESDLIKEKGDFKNLSDISLEFENPTESKEVLRRFGYNRDKRPDLPQINVMLGVNQQHIPLFFEVFSGNTIDLEMFEVTLKRLNTSYKDLLGRMKRKFIIFDRGNMSPRTTLQLDTLCTEWDLHFIGGALTSLLKDEFLKINEESLPLIFSQKKTHIYGIAIETIVYERPYKALLYMSKSVRKHNLLKFEKKIENVTNLLNEIKDQGNLSDIKKVQKMETLLRKKSMINLFSLKKFKTDEIEKKTSFPPDKLYQLIEEKFNAKIAKIMKKDQSLSQFQSKFNKVQILLAEIDMNEEESPVQKVQRMLIVLKKYSMISLFLLKKFTSEQAPETSIELTEELYSVKTQTVESKKRFMGMFVVLTSDFSLTAKEIIKLYKTKETVEHEFHLLKSLFNVRPFYHRCPSRIVAHTAIVHWSMLFMSVLRYFLEQKGLFYSFEELHLLIKQGKMQKATFLYPGYKNFQISRSVDISPELDQIFSFLKIKPQPFHIESFTNI